MEQCFDGTAQGVTVSGTSTASAAVSLGTSTGNTVLVYNEGPNTAFFALGTTNAVAATLPTASPTRTCMQIPAGSVQTFARPPDYTFVSVICRAAGTAVVNFYVGEGA